MALESKLLVLDEIWDGISEDKTDGLSEGLPGGKVEWLDDAKDGLLLGASDGAAVGDEDAKDFRFEGQSDGEDIDGAVEFTSKFLRWLVVSWMPFACAEPTIHSNCSNPNTHPPAAPPLWEMLIFPLIVLNLWSFS